MDMSGRSTPTRRLAERSSTEIVHSLFGPSVGVCRGDFACNHHRQRGRLYASTNAICFFSNLFGFERRICLALEDIEDISTHGTTSICITATEPYIFKSFSDREFVTALLLQLKHKTKYVRGRSLATQEDLIDIDTAEQIAERSKSLSAMSDADDESVQSDRSSVDMDVTRDDPREAWEELKNATDPSYKDTALDVRSWFHPLSLQSVESSSNAMFPSSL